jgi:hypothetical protein
MPGQYLRNEFLLVPKINTMRVLTLVIFLFIFSSSLQAQVINKVISGQIKDIQNEPVPGATIRLLIAEDSIVIQTIAAKDNGKFEFTNLTNGTFILRITSAGKKEYATAPLTIDNNRSSIVLPVIVLLPGKKTELKEVVVVAKRPLIEHDLDKTIVNPDAMISSATSNTLEVLEKTPGITVSTDGEISLNGKNGVLVLIEGRPTYMSGTDLAAYLRSLPGSMLDKIELMSNPPAKYDAAGSAVINIRLKKNKAQGYTGNISLNYSQGKTGKSFNYLNLNYLKRKVNLFGNFSYGRDDNSMDDIYERTFYNDNSSKISSVDLKNHFLYYSNDFSGRLGMDYTVSSKTTIGFTANAGIRPRKDKINYRSNTYGSSDALDSIGYGYTNGSSVWKQAGTNFNYQHKFNDAGKELSADLNYINYNNDGDQVLQRFTKSASGQLTGSDSFLYQLPSSIHIYTGKADYSHPLKNKLNLSVGIKSSIVNTDNQYGYFNTINNENFPDYSQSNHFIYRENINATYVNGRKDWKRVALQLGLRLENTQTKGHQLGNAATGESVFRRSYTGLFPTAFVSYKLDSNGKHTIGLNIARRLNRPGYQQLNPFIFFRDQYSYTTGNPDLGPAYGNRVELSYKYKQFLNIQLQYDHLSQNVIDAVQSKGDVFITQPQNVSGGHLFALFVNTNYSPANWVKINLHLGAARFVNRANIYAETIDVKFNTWRSNLYAQFTINKSWDAELSGNYQARLISWQRIFEPKYRINTAVQKKILKGKGSLKLSADDLFHLWKQKTTITSLKNAESFYTSIQDSQRIGISFSWSIGKETFARKRKYNDNTADDVKGRVE